MSYQNNSIFYGKHFILLGQLITCVQSILVQSILMAEKITGKIYDRHLLKRMLGYLAPYRNQFFLALFLTIILAILVPIRPYLFQYILDNEVANGDYQGLRTFVFLIIGLLILQGGIMYVSTYLTNWLGQSVIRDIRQEIFQHILNLRLKYFDHTPIGRLQTRAIHDVEALNQVFSSGLVRILSESLQLVAIFAFMLMTNWKLTLVVLTTLPLSLIATYVFKNKVKVAFQQVRKAVSEINSFVQEHLTGMTIVHVFNREEEEMDRFDKINRDLRRAHLNSVLYYSIFFPVVEMIAALGTALLVWYGARNVVGGEITFGVLVAFIMYISMFFRPIRLIADQFNILQMGIVSAERIFKVLDTHEFIENNGQAPELKKIEKGIGIELKNVKFAYNEPEWVLKNINIKVSPGEKVALVGSTGSGKTTIINLISRFYRLQEGEIFIDDRNIKEYDLNYLRSLIGVVLQDVFLFSGSIRDNITLNNPNIPLEQVKAAAKKVGAHDFISQLPGQYDYNVRERGATLSLGQRQLIAFARVMTYDPRILVLDEATANIDSESEEVIQAAIDTVMAGRTSIIIAHRLSTIQKADKIVLLKKGEIAEMGSHDELLKQEGDYFRLYQLQFAN